MTTNYCMVICFVMIGVNLIIIYSKLKAIDKLDKLFISWREHTLHLEKRINDLYVRQEDGIKNLDRAYKCIRELEERLEAHAAELTEHHNKIDTLEINEGLFERIPDLEDKIKALEDTVEYLEGEL